MGWCSVLPARIVLVLSSGCPTCRARAFQWLSSLPCSCAGAGRSNAAFWNKCISRVSMESSGDMSHQGVCCGGLSSPAVTSLRCIRPVRDEDVQGILVGFQGDGNERSGHPSHPLTPPPKRRPGSAGERGNWGWGGMNPDRPAKAAQIRESPSALPLAVPARCRTTKWKSWSARNHLVTLTLVSFAQAIHCRGAWSVMRVNLRPRR